MIEKEFVPHTEALALKELGFYKAPVFGLYYTLDGVKWKFALTEEFNRIDDELNIGGKFTALAPTYSQAFKWFREKYKLSGEPQSHQFYFSYYIIYNTLGENKCKNNEHGFDSYEEAELACLIKLIETVKKNESN